jgi:hypothetical protein
MGVARCSVIQRHVIELQNLDSDSGNKMRTLTQLHSVNQTDILT